MTTRLRRLTMPPRLGVLLVILGLLAAACSGSESAGASPEASPEASSEASSAADTAEAVFLSEDTIHEISVEFDQDDYDAAIAAYQADQSKEWITATVTIDGTEYTDVGMRLKGNSSLFGLGGDNRGGAGGNVDASSPETLPWLIRLDKYVDGQNHDGIYDLVVRSNNSTTALNEAVALDLLELAGLASQDSAYASFSVSGSDPVLRLVVQNPDDVWMAAHFSSDGTLYKAEATGDYSYRGDDPDSYDEVFDIEAGDGDLSPLIEFLDFINNSDDETFYAELEQWLDTDSFATYLAVQDLIANSDDIDGRGNNSYLYLDPETGRFTVVPWDHNLAFGGAGFAGGALAGGGPMAIDGAGQVPAGQVPAGQAAAGQAPAGASDGFTQLDNGSGTEATAPADISQDGSLPADGAVPGQGDFTPGARGQLAGPGAAGPQASNVLVDRFLADADYAALYQSELDRLTTELYNSGAASEILDKWVSLLEGSGLVDDTVISSEAASISSFFS